MSHDKVREDPLTERPAQVMHINHARLHQCLGELVKEFQSDKRFSGVKPTLDDFMFWLMEAAPKESV